MHTLNRCMSRAWVMSAVAVFAGTVLVSTSAAAAPESPDLKMDAITFDPPLDQYDHHIDKGNIKIKCQWSSTTFRQ